MNFIKRNLGVLVGLAAFAAVITALYVMSTPRVKENSFLIADSVVLLSQGTGHGSGVVIDAERGLILTAKHVAEHAELASESPMQLTTSDHCHAIIDRVLWLGEENDVALIQVNPATCKLHAATIRTEPMQVGEAVTAVGYPIWLGRTVTTGHVVATDVTPPAKSESKEVFLVTDALVTFGNSGGALFDANGYLVGIVVAMANTGGFMPVPTGHELIIPISTVCTLLACN